jgi:malto-oligosyltrehalose trehalohydrolase
VKNRFHFRKSWGAETAGEGTCFRLWAPSERALSLRIEGGNGNIPMRRNGDGWFEVETDAIQAGDGYSFVLANGTVVNDPAARAQLSGVNGPSRLVDPLAYEWQVPGWRGRPLQETIIYELHAGAFSPEGTFDGIRRRLDHLVETGVTAIELMPVAEFAGARGWGYDGVLPYAPHSVYGGPAGLKQLVDSAHERELMVILDVVYNHFGPEGNYLHLYAPDFFHAEELTPWGAAIAYEKRPVRDFFIENALYWLEEYRFDGLRLDAIDQIAVHDRSADPILEEIALSVRACMSDRHVHLFTEDDRNVCGLHGRDKGGRPLLYSAEWNDDFHHAAHQIATAETIGYYADYAERPVEQLARALASGYIYQGEASAYRDNAARGEPSGHLPPSAFVNFLQNHDQIGNRAYSERLTLLAAAEIVEALMAVLLLSPQIPLLFMGEEWGETNPFRYFTDFDGELASAVREGRRREFAKWPQFASEEHSALIADPNAESTFDESRLDWRTMHLPSHRARLQLVRTLIDVRRREIVPLIGRIGGNSGSFDLFGDGAFSVRWQLAEGGVLRLFANLGEAEALIGEAPAGRIIHAHGDDAEAALKAGSLPPRAVVSMIEMSADFVPLPI